LAYFAEAVLVGRKMRELGISHVHASFSATVALIAAKIFPITWSFGVYGYGELHDPTASHLRERIASVKFVRSISRFGRGQLMLACDRDDFPKLLYSPLGIYHAEFEPLTIQAANPGPRLLCVGRLSQEKNQALLLESVAQLKSQGHAVELHLVGDGPDRQRLEDYANQLGIASCVVFEGWLQQEQLMMLYRSADIFVMSSLAEGIPMVLMEAMALEKPCVAPRIAGIPELIEHGVDGLLFAAADRDDLTHRLSALLESPDARRNLGRRAREKVLRDYDGTRNTRRFADLLEQQLQSPEHESHSLGD
jgi:glycosyltransferase involved in cell wall biosynthesis